MFYDETSRPVSSWVFRIPGVKKKLKKPSTIEGIKWIWNIFQKRYPFFFLHILVKNSHFSKEIRPLPKWFILHGRAEHGFLVSYTMILNQTWESWFLNVGWQIFVFSMYFTSVTASDVFIRHWLSYKENFGFR